MGRAGFWGRLVRIVQMCGKAPTPAGIPQIVGAERWVIGSAYPDIPQPFDRIFDVHPWAFIAARRPEAWAWYQTLTCQVYLRDREIGIPGAQYPRDEIAAQFGARANKAFSSSIDQMMALALWEGVDQIHLSGVWMLSLEEWVLQRECLGYWIGQAEARGVEVFTDPEAALCTPEVVYGFDERTGAVRAPGQFVMIHGMPGAEVLK